MNNNMRDIPKIEDKIFDITPTVGEYDELHDWAEEAEELLKILPLMPDNINTPEEMVKYLMGVYGLIEIEKYNKVKHILRRVWGNADITESLASDELCEEVEKAIK